MRQNITLHVEAGDLVSVNGSDGKKAGLVRCEWLTVGNVSFFCPDPETADRIAAAFDELAEKMREAKRAEDGDSYGEVTDPHSGDMATYHLTASGAAARLATHDPDDRR